MFTVKQLTDIVLQKPLSVTKILKSFSH